MHIKQWTLWTNTKAKIVMFLTNYRESLSNYSQKDILVRIPQCDNSFCCNSQNRPIQRKCGRCHWLFSALETIIYHKDSELRVSITRLCCKNMLICICIFFFFCYLPKDPYQYIWHHVWQNRGWGKRKKGKGEHFFFQMLGLQRRKEMTKNNHMDSLIFSPISFHFWRKDKCGPMENKSLHFSFPQIISPTKQRIYFIHLAFYLPFLPFPPSSPKP